MVAELDDGLGLLFTQDLSLAIEEYTSWWVGIKPNSFFYNGMNLRPAVERWLYIHCVNSPAIFERYLLVKGINQDLKANTLLTELEAEVASFFEESHFGLRKNAWSCLRIRLRARAFFAWLWGCRRWQVEKKSARMHGKRTRILIRVVSAKFADYLRSITDRCDKNSCEYLCVNDRFLESQLQEKWGGTTSAINFGPSFRSIFVGVPLIDFRPLLLDAEAVFSALKLLLPKNVLVVEGNAPSDVITSEACRLLGIPCFCMQQGWSPYVHVGFRNMNFSEMFVWGKRFAELLRPYNPKQRFFVTGNPVVKFPGRAITQKNLATRTVSFFLQAPSQLISQSTFDAFVDLIAGVAADHQRVRVVVREHPGYPLPIDARRELQAYENVHFSMPRIESLADVIAASDMVVSIFSTVLLEALAMNVVPLICSIGAMRQYEPDIASAGAAIEVQSVVDARRVIDEMIAEPQRLTHIRESMAKISAEFFSSEDAAQMIANRLQGSSRHTRIGPQSNG